MRRPGGPVTTIAVVLMAASAAAAHAANQPAAAPEHSAGSTSISRVPAAGSPPAAGAYRALLEELRAAEQRSGGVLGVAAWRLDGAGPRVLLNEAEAFPMASTFKVAVAAKVLSLIDAGQLSLDDMAVVDPGLHVESEVIANRLIHPGVSLSVHNLLELMITQSDNTATDVLMRLAGGTGAVTEWLHRSGVSGQRVDRDTAGLLRDFLRLPPGPFNAVLAQALERDPTLEQLATLPNDSFDNDPRDTSTPEAMSVLLTHIFAGAGLSGPSTDELTAMMGRCRTGETRLKGLMPAGTFVAHKTGTLGGSVNDVGVVTLPQNRGRVVISVFVKKSALPIAERERAIAEVARSVRDFYLFSPLP